MTAFEQEVVSGRWRVCADKAESYFRSSEEELPTYGRAGRQMGSIRRQRRANRPFLMFTGEIGFDQLWYYIIIEGRHGHWFPWQQPPSRSNIRGNPFSNQTQAGMQTGGGGVTTAVLTSDENKSQLRRV